MSKSNAQAKNNAYTYLLQAIFTVPNAVKDPATAQIK